MKKVLIVGSVAFDDIKTPFGAVESAIGGSATYASLACSLFSKPAVVGVVGGDFPQRHLDMLKSKGIDISGIEVKKGAKTFHWSGEYGADLNAAKTLRTDLNVLAEFKPELPGEFGKADFLFLGNIGPELQLNVLSQMRKRPKLVVADTMNLWIETKREKVLEVVRRADIALMNDAEARQLFQTTSLVNAAKEILALDSKFAIIKKGEHGAVMFTNPTEASALKRRSGAGFRSVDGLQKKAHSFGSGFFTRDSHFACPGYPLENVKDPTGSGDCFGGALIGYLAKTNDFSQKNMRKAIVYASCVASFNAEDFSVGRLKSLTITDIKARYSEFKRFVKF